MVASVGVRDGEGQRLSSRGGSWMKARDRLSHTWRELARCHGCETTRAEVVLDELLRVYSEPTRKYHTIEHIGSLLHQLEEHGHAVVDRDAVVLAMLFHDVVYDPLRHDIEVKSAALAGERLAFLGFPGGIIAKVEQYICATKYAQDFVTRRSSLSQRLRRGRGHADQRITTAKVGWHGPGLDRLFNPDLMREGLAGDPPAECEMQRTAYGDADSPRQDLQGAPCRLAAPSARHLQLPLRRVERRVANAARSGRKARSQPSQRLRTFRSIERALTHVAASLTATKRETA